MYKEPFDSISINFIKTDVDLNNSLLLPDEKMTSVASPLSKLEGPTITKGSSIISDQDFVLPSETLSYKKVVPISVPKPNDLAE